MGQGSVSNGVKALQGAVLCYITHDIEVDGVYGYMTGRSVEVIQQVNGITIDGVYGPQTHNVIEMWSPTIANVESDYCAADTPI